MYFFNYVKVIKQKGCKTRHIYVFPNHVSTAAALLKLHWWRHGHKNSLVLSCSISSRQSADDINQLTARHAAAQLSDCCPHPVVLTAVTLMSNVQLSITFSHSWLRSNLRLGMSFVTDWLDLLLSRGLDCVFRLNSDFLFLFTR